MRGNADLIRHGSRRSIPVTAIVGISNDRNTQRLADAVNAARSPIIRGSIGHPEISQINKKAITTRNVTTVVYLVCAVISLLLLLLYGQ